MPDLRENLLAYMREQKISLSALAARIQAASGEDVRTKTLNRFLTGEMRIADRVVATFKRFMDQQRGR